RPRVNKPPFQEKPSQSVPIAKAKQRQQSETDWKPRQLSPPGLGSEVLQHRTDHIERHKNETLTDSIWCDVAVGSNLDPQTFNNVWPVDRHLASGPELPRHSKAYSYVDRFRFGPDSWLAAEAKDPGQGWSAPRFPTGSALLWIA